MAAMQDGMARDGISVGLPGLTGPPKGGWRGMARFYAVAGAKGKAGRAWCVPCEGRCRSAVGASEGVGQLRPQARLVLDVALCFVVADLPGCQRTDAPGSG